MNETTTSHLRSMKQPSLISIHWRQKESRYMSLEIQVLVGLRLLIGFKPLLNDWISNDNIDINKPLLNDWISNDNIDINKRYVIIFKYTCQSQVIIYFLSFSRCLCTETNFKWKMILESLKCLAALSCCVINCQHQITLVIAIFQ